MNRTSTYNLTYEYPPFRFPLPDGRPRVEEQAAIIFPPKIRSGHGYEQRVGLYCRDGWWG